MRCFFCACAWAGVCKKVTKAFLKKKKKKTALAPILEEKDGGWGTSKWCPVGMRQPCWNLKSIISLREPVSESCPIPLWPYHWLQPHLSPCRLGAGGGVQLNWKQIQPVSLTVSQWHLHWSLLRWAFMASASCWLYLTTWSYFRSGHIISPFYNRRLRQRTLAWWVRRYCTWTWTADGTPTLMATRCESSLWDTLGQP